MGKQQDRRIIQQLLATAGITINGSNPWDIQILDERFYSRVMAEPDLGLGETYMEGWWECPSLDEFIYRCLRANLDKQIVTHRSWLLSAILSEIKHWLKHLFNQQTKIKALQVGKHHYDIDDDIYDAMLDPTRSYTCAYWKNSTRLEEAQLAKLKLVCEKLYLKPGQRVLDIGCGWGGFAKFAAKNYGVHVTGVTISEKQFNYAKNDCKALPVEIRFQDYRDLNEKFDRICSIGMFEHVGYKNYRHYMEIVARCLADDGLFLLHTIGGNISQKHSNAWIDKYIFPNGLIPSIAQIGKAYEGLLIMEDWHNFGTDYHKTLLAWHERFIQHWPTVSKHYSESFKRQWQYYLLSCAGAFRARDLQLWQIVFSKQGIIDGYTSIR